MNEFRSEFRVDNNPKVIKNSYKLKCYKKNMNSNVTGNINENSEMSSNLVQPS